VKLKTSCAGLLMVIADVAQRISLQAHIHTGICTKSRTKPHQSKPNYKKHKLKVACRSVKRIHYATHSNMMFKLHGATVKFGLTKSKTLVEMAVHIIFASLRELMKP